MIRDGVRRLFHLALPQRLERDVDDEIELHLALRTQQLVDGGMSAEEARAEAARQFGGIDAGRQRLVRAATRRERRARLRDWLSDFGQDLHFAVRTFARHRGWAATAIITLALGIGATTTMFSIFSTLVLHAVPYPEADRVVVLELRPVRNGKIDPVRMSAPARIVGAWRSQAHGFESIEPVSSTYGTMATMSGEPSQVNAGRVSSTFATFAGATVLRGRMFTAEEERARAPVVVLSEEIWRTRFGAQDSVIGRSIRISDTARVIVGVLSPTKLVSMNDQPQVWLPVDVGDYRSGLRALGRLRPGTSAIVAAADLDSISQHSGFFPPGRLLAVADVSRPAHRLRFRDSLFLLGSAVAMVLIVACGNTLHLLVTRGLARRREFVVRTTLGAGRARLARQLITESLVLAASAAIAGLALGAAALRVIVHLRPSTLVELDAAHLDATTALVVIGLSVMCALLFGVIASMRSAVPDDAVRNTVSTISKGAERLRALLVIGEVMISAALVVAATLLIRSVVARQHADLGFRPAGLWGVTVNLPRSRYDERQTAAFVDELSARLRAAPGVRDVAFSEVGPFGGSSAVGVLEVEGEPTTPGANGFVDVNSVAPGYFRTMGIPLVEGTTFSDASEHSTQAIINAGYARRHWPAGQAIGHRIRIANQGEGTWRTIVGVAADAMFDGPVLDHSAPFVYEPGSSNHRPALMFRMDSGVDPDEMVKAIVHGIDPRLPPVFAGSMEGSVKTAMVGPRFTTAILTGFTVVALLLAAVGLYGTLSYAVAQRSREIGIRVALGATSRAIGRAVIARGIVLVIIGALLGLAGALWATKFIQSQLYGVQPLDLPSFAIGAGVLLFAGLMACIIPMRRALAVDPIAAIRAD
jgi:predicted permease